VLVRPDTMSYQGETEDGGNSVDRLARFSARTAIGVTAPSLPKS